VLVIQLTLHNIRQHNNKRDCADVYCVTLIKTLKDIKVHTSHLGSTHSLVLNMNTFHNTLRTFIIIRTYTQANV